MGDDSSSRGCGFESHTSYTGLTLHFFTKWKVIVSQTVKVLLTSQNENITFNVLLLIRDGTVHSRISPRVS